LFPKAEHTETELLLGNRKCSQFTCRPINELGEIRMKQPNNSLSRWCSTLLCGKAWRRTENLNWKNNYCGSKTVVIVVCIKMNRPTMFSSDG